MNSTRKGVLFNSAFQRRFVEVGVQTLKINGKITVIGGFNVFDTRNDDYRSYWGYGDEIEIVLGETAENNTLDKASFNLVSTLATLTMTALALLVF